MKRKPPISLLLAATVFIVSFTVYANTLGHGFVWDDRALVPDNPDIATLDGPALAHLFTSHFWEPTGKPGGLYRPLVSLSYRLDHQIHGLDAGGYHLSNVVINAVVAVLVFLLVLVLFGTVWVAFLTATLFAVLPLHTENVAWIAGRSDSLAAVGMLGCLASWVLWRRRGEIVFALLSVLFLVWALLCKEIAVITPLLVVVIELGPFELGRSRGRSVAERYGPLAALGVVTLLYLVVRRQVLDASLLLFKPFASGIVGTIALALATFGHYSLKLVFPFALNAESEVAVPESSLDPSSLLGVGVLLGTAYALYRWRRTPEIVFGIAVLLLGLLPVLNLVPMSETSAERFLYIPSLGFVLIVAYLIAALARRGATQKSVAVGLAIVIAFAWGARTFARNGDWRDETTLFKKTVAADSESARAHLNLGNVMYREQRYREALVEYDKALALDPDYAGAWSSKAGAHKALGQMMEAMRAMQRALAIEPDNANFHSSLGVLHMHANRLSDARSSFRRALAIHPGHDDARMNLGLASYMAGDYGEARTSFDALRHKDTLYPHAYFYLASIAEAEGARAGAVENATKFLSVYPKDDDYRARAKKIIAGKP